MSVYIDSLHDFNNDNEDTPRCFRNKDSCHLFADTLEELHSFALRLGMKRSWFQNHKTLPHYDLVTSKRRLALMGGAIELDGQKLLDKWKEIKEKKLTSF